MVFEEKLCLLFSLSSFCLAIRLESSALPMYAMIDGYAMVLECARRIEAPTSKVEGFRSKVGSDLWKMEMQVV